MEKHYCDHCGKPLNGSKNKFQIKPLTIVAEIFNQSDTIELCKKCTEQFKKFTGKQAKPKENN